MRGSASVVLDRYSVTMELFACVVFVVMVAAAKGSRDDNYVAYSRCYDCNYAPSGHVRVHGDWQTESSEVGYLSCALTTLEDQINVHRNACSSNRCYIRRDENGLVYRGCADDRNLPWDVNSYVNCKYQGPSKSLWWFCEGDSCNDGQLGDTEERCGSPPPPAELTLMEDEAAQDDESTQEDPAEDPMEDPGEEQPHDAYNYNPYSAHLVALSLLPFRGHPGAPGYRDHVLGSNGQRQHSHPHHPHATPEKYNPCDGECHRNPSGLYADPARKEYFIQCGCANHHGHPCTCCNMTYLPCPPNTFFNDYFKVCVRRHTPY